MPDHEECFTYFNTPHLPGVELLEANTRSEWRWYLTDFVWIAPITWEGDVLCHQRTHRLAPGSLACVDPGGLCRSLRVIRPGRLLAAFIEPSAVATEPVGAKRTRAESPRQTTTPLGASGSGPQERFLDFCAAVRVGAPVEGLRECLRVMDQDAEGGGPDVLRFRRPAYRCPSVAERLRDLMDADPNGQHSVGQMSQRLGITRFQASRAFKEQLGVAPSAYQMCLRIAGAQRALRSGAAPATVAAEFGFSDQSHLGRHFKRMLGVSPGRYARSAAQR